MNALRLDPSCTSAQQLRKRVKDVERLKEEGNVAFKAGKLQHAVNSYTEALDVCSSLFVLPRHELTLKYSVLGNRRRKVKAVKSVQPSYPIALPPSSRFAVS